MHGGAKGAGAPKENQNTVKHGIYGFSRHPQGWSGQKRRTVRETKIKMQDKFRALILLGKHLGLFKTRRKCK